MVSPTLSCAPWINKTSVPVHRKCGIIVLSDLLIEDEESPQDNRKDRLSRKAVDVVKQP